MRDAAREVQTYVRGRRREDLDQDSMLTRALERVIEIIGEAATRVTEETVEQCPSIPWREIRGMRNRLVHAYFEVDRDILWAAAADEIPSLAEELERLLAEIEGGPGNG